MAGQKSPSIYGQPAPAVTVDIPSDIDWVNMSDQGLEGVYAYSEENRILFYISDYEAYTYN